MFLVGTASPAVRIQADSEWEATLRVDDDALVVAGVSDNNHLELPLSAINFDAVAVTDGGNAVRIPRTNGDTVLAAPLGETDVEDVLLLLATARDSL